MKTLKLVLLTTWACFALKFAGAQTPEAQIRGLILDSSKQPVDAATVVLVNAKDSATIKTMLTNADGSFAFADVKPGNYRVVVTSVGFRNYKGAAFSFNQQSIKLPGITLSATSKTLKQVEIAETKNLVEQKIDRTVLNVNASITNTGANALEVLEKAPGVIVDADGNITFKGKSGVMIMIDDKPTYLSGDSLVAYLKSLPAAMLDQIELMPNPPAKYDASGNAGIINIKTKKSKAAGFNGAFSTSVGRAVFWRTLNSLNLNYHVNKVNLFANLGYGIGNNYRRLDVVRTYMDNADHITSSYTEEAYFHPVSYNHNLKMGMDYYVTPKTTIGFVLTGALTEAHNTNPVYSKLADGAGQLDSSIIANNYTQSQFLNGGINLNYSHQFDKKGRSLTFDLDYLRYDSNRDQTFFNTSYNSAGATGSIQNIVDKLPTAINIYTAKTDYTQPLGGKAKIETGLKTGFVNTDNAANYYNIINNIQTVDNNMTNRFLYNENINAAYISYDNEFKRFAIKAGLRAENTNVKAHQLGNIAGSDSSFTQHYTSLFPTAYVLYKLDTAGSHTLKLSYGRRIERPGYQDLNPFVTVLDKYSAFEGNPFLRPQFISEYELTYAYKSAFSLTLEYHPITDYQVEYDFQKGSIFYATSMNLNTRAYWNINANIALSPTKWWSFNFYTEAVHSHYQAQLPGFIINTSTNYFYFNNSNQFNLSHGWNAELSTFYLSPSQDAQFTHRYREQTNVGISKKILNNKGVLKLTARDVFRANFSAGNITNVPNAAITYHNDNGNRSVTFGFTYNFGSNKDTPKRRDTGGAASEAGRVGN